MTYKIGDEVVVLIDRKRYRGTIVGGTPFGVTIELEDGRVVGSNEVYGLIRL